MEPYAATFYEDVVELAIMHISGFVYSSWLSSTLYRHVEAYLEFFKERKRSIGTFAIENYMIPSMRRWIQVASESYDFESNQRKEESRNVVEQKVAELHLAIDDLAAFLLPLPKTTGVSAAPGEFELPNRKIQASAAASVESEINENQSRESDAESISTLDSKDEEVKVLFCDELSFDQPCAFAAVTADRDRQSSVWVPGCVHTPYFVESNADRIANISTAWYVEAIGAINALLDFCDQREHRASYNFGGREMMIEFRDFIANAPEEGVPSFPDRWDFDMRMNFNKLAVTRASALTAIQRGFCRVEWGKRQSPSKDIQAVVVNDVPLPSNLLVCRSDNLLKAFPWTIPTVATDDENLPMMDNEPPLARLVVFDAYIRLASRAVSLLPIDSEDAYTLDQTTVDGTASLLGFNQRSINAEPAELQGKITGRNDSNSDRNSLFNFTL